MSVYVDKLCGYPTPAERQAARVAAKNDNRWCHMIADSLDELHAMAARIGMKREWFQQTSTPHYDLTPGRRAVAVKLGAVECDRTAFVEHIRRIRGDR